MNKMIERVARAICGTMSGTGNDHQWEMFFDEARAAIEAMREPTEEMEGAGNSPTYIWVDETASDVWPRMIDAALKERP